MAINDIVQTIAEARVDARSLSEFVFKPASFIVVRRLAPSVRTLQYYVDRFETIDSGFTQALNTANTAVVTATNNAVGLIDSVTNNAYNQISSAIDGVAIDANLVTDALITTSIRKPNQVVRTQASKNADFINVKDFGAVGDGVTDDYPAIMAAINSVTFNDTATRKVGQKVYFPLGKYYISQTLNIHKVVILEGESMPHAVGKGTTIIAAPNIDGIVIHRHNTEGTYGGYVTTPYNNADGSSLRGLHFTQKGYVRDSLNILDYNPASQQIVCQRSIPNGTAVVCNNDRYSQVSYTGNIASAPLEITCTLELSKPILSLAMGSAVSNGAGASGTVAHIATSVVAILLTNTTGTFKVGDTITVGSEVSVIKRVTTHRMNIIKLSGTGTLKPLDILSKSTDYGSGITARARCHIENCSVSDFPFHGLAFATDSNQLGNANCMVVNNISINNIGRNGVYSEGGDSNAGAFTGIDTNNCTGYGIKDSSFLGNHYFGCHSSSNNQGAYYSAEYNNFSVFLGCYSEGGSQVQPFLQPISRFGRNTTVIGGDHGGGWSSTMPNYGFANLNGSFFEAGKALYGNRKLTATGSYSEYGLTITGDAQNAEHLSLVSGGGAEYGYGCAIGHYLGTGSNKWDRDRSHAKLAVTTGAAHTEKGFGYVINTTSAYQPAVVITPVESPLAGSSVIRVSPVIQNNIVTSLTIHDTGDNYEGDTCLLKGKSIFDGFEAVGYLFNGRLVDYKITKQPTDMALADTSVKRALVVMQDALEPNDSGKYRLGSSSSRFSTINLDSAIYQASDAATVDITDLLTPTIIDAWGDVSVNTFTNKQTGVKQIAYSGELIKSAFAAKGLNAETLGLIKEESWQATTALPRVNGVEHYVGRDAGSVLTVNILSCLALEAAYQRRKYTLLEARVAALENV